MVLGPILPQILPIIMTNFKRGSTKLIDVMGADHGGYVKRIQAATQAVTKGQADVKVMIAQIVRFFDNGQPFKNVKTSW